MIRKVLKAICLSTAFSLVCVSTSLAQNDWEFVLAPYAMFPNISGSSSIGRADGADIDVSTGDILDTLEFGAMLQAEAHHSSGLGVVLNYAFMDLGDEATGPLGFTDFDADVFQANLEGYLSYRFQYTGGTLDGYVGARWWDIDIDVDATLAGRTRTFSRDEDWVDPVVGARWMPSISEEWRLLLQGDLGGFSISSDLTWNVMGGFLWDASETFSLALLYRFLAVDYEKGPPGTPDRFTYDTNTQGPILGAVFRF